MACDLLEALPAAVYLTDAAGLLTYYNRAAADFWGWWPDLGRARWCGSWLLFCLDGTPLPHDQCPWRWQSSRTGRCAALKPWPRGRMARDTIRAFSDAFAQP